MTYMFDVTCPRHGHRVLLFGRQYRLANTDHGVEVHWTCSCGTKGVELMGARARRPLGSHPVTGNAA